MPISTPRVRITEPRACWPACQQAVALARRSIPSISSPGGPRPVGRAGLYGEAAEAAAAAIGALGDSDEIRQALLAERVASHLWNAGDEPGALRTVEAAILTLESKELANSEASAARGTLMADYTQFLIVAQPIWRPDRRCWKIAFAREAGSDEALVSALISEAMVVGRLDSMRGISLLETARALAEAHGNVRAILRADVNLGVLLDARADFEALGGSILRGASRPPRTMVWKGRQPPSTTTWRGWNWRRAGLARRGR